MLESSIQPRLQPIDASAPVPLLSREIEFAAFAAYLALTCLVLCISVGIALSSTIFRDGDTNWQIAAGRWMLAHARIPTSDPFSFTVAGRPWVAMEWLSELLYGGAFDLDGYAGVAAVVAAALVAFQAVVFFHLQRRASLAVLVAAMVMLDVVLAPFAMARPHLIAWPLLAAWTAVLLHASERGRAPSLWCALILVVWTNAHASFPLALPIAAAIGLDSLIEQRWANLRHWLLFGLVSTAALMLNWNGVAGLLQPFETARLTMLPLIGEWRPSSTVDTPGFFAVLIVLFGAALWVGVRVPIGRLLLLLLLLALALLHMRHQPPFAIVAALVLPPLFRSRPMRAPASMWPLLGSAPLLAYVALSGFTPAESTANPLSLIAAVPVKLRAEPVFSDYNFGGSLILAGIRPYIDERAEIYGDAFVARYEQIQQGDLAAFDQAEHQYDIQWVMLRRSDKLLIARIEASGEWRRIYSNKIGIIDERAAPTPPHA